MADNRRARLTKFEDEFLGDNIGIFQKIAGHLRALWVLVFNGMPDDDVRREAQWNIEEAGRATRRGYDMNYRELKNRQESARK